MMAFSVNWARVVDISRPCTTFIGEPPFRSFAPANSRAYNTSKHLGPEPTFYCVTPPGPNRVLFPTAGPWTCLRR